MKKKIKQWLQIPKKKERKPSVKVKLQKNPQLDV